MLKQNSISFTSLFIPGGEEESMVMNLRFGLLEWLDIGVGYGIKEKNLILTS